TLTGPVDVADLGPTLMHEHVFTMNAEYLHNYGEGGWWDETAELDRAAEKLTRLADKGITTIVDPTVLGLGRDVTRLLRLAPRVPVNIIVATGVYTYDSLPFPYSMQGPGRPLGGDDPLVRDFTRDITEGIGDTGVKAAFLKCAVEHDPMTPDVEHALRAVARTSVVTGAPITVHTSAAEHTADRVIEILEDEEVDLTKVVLGHTGDSTDVDWLASLADTGATLGMDRFGLDVFATTDARVATIAELARRGYADRMVLSHDASCRIDWFGPDSPELVDTLMPNWNYEHISNDVLPALRALGVSDAQVDAMLIDNPRRYFGG
ncbi:MAG: phosphotriesterase, partial [Actinobacteria bacterium]|nr:phosphotriesterase [Actinomycetota bacterium]